MDCVRFVRDQSGGVLVETTVMLTIILLVVIGSIDFLFAFYQWNAATKAVEIGARIAAVSDPVAIGLDRLSAAVISATLNPEDPMPYFSVTCVGANATCTCTGACSGMGGFSDSAMNNIVFGRGNSACTAASTFYYIGMCNIFDRIGVTNVIVVYTQTGLGYVGRPGGPAPNHHRCTAKSAIPVLFLGSADWALTTLKFPP